MFADTEDKVPVVLLRHLHVVFTAKFVQIVKSHLANSYKPGLRHLMPQTVLQIWFGAAEVEAADRVTNVIR